MDFRWNKKYYNPKQDVVIDQNKNFYVTLSHVEEFDKQGNSKGDVLIIKRWRKRRDPKTKQLYFLPKRGYGIRNKTQAEKLITALSAQNLYALSLGEIKVTKELVDIVDFLRKSKIKPEGLKSLFDVVFNKSAEEILQNYTLYENRLKEFRSLISDQTSKEVKIRDFLAKNYWIFDFKYKDLATYTEKSTKVGKIDIFAYNEYLTVRKDFFLELKTPKKESAIKEYRGKPAIIAEVGNAISQLINYMEEEKTKNVVANGMVIVGRKKDAFVQVFNQYLNQIKIKTYEDILEDAEKRLKAFKS